jgi:ribosomal protein S18 acetylase RimI-like enzyme
VERLSAGLRASTDRAALFEFLEADELRHITPIKMLTMFGDAMNVHPVISDNERGYILVVRSALSQWDSAKYPHATFSVYVALPAQASDRLIETMATRMLLETRGEPFVVKTIEPRLVQRLQAMNDARLPLHYRLALLTFTPNERAVPQHAAYEVETTNAARNSRFERIPDVARPLLNAHNVYSNDELDAMFADGTARCWLRFVGNDAAAVLLTFANSKSLHEIGSLYVHPSARRAGHAQALVHAALDDIAARGLKVRYVVDATNTASISLAQQCGLREALRAEHWYTPKTR